MLLSDLKPGDSAKITRINTLGPGVVQLMRMGMIEGVTVHLENVKGNLLEVSFFGSTIILRKRQARYFEV